MAIAGDATEEQPPPRPVEPLAGLLDQIGAVGEGGEGGGAVPAAWEAEPQPGACCGRASSKPDVDLGKEVERAGRDPVGGRVAVEVRTGRTLAVDGDRVAEVRVRTARRPHERAAVPDETAGTTYVGGPVVPEDEAKGGDLVDARQQPVDVCQAGFAAREPDDVVDAVGGTPCPEGRRGKRGERGGGEERAVHPITGPR